MPVGYWDERESFEPDVDDAQDRAEWANGRDRYATFLWSIEDDAVGDALETVADRLDSFDCVRGVPARYLHVTIKKVGFVVDEPTAADEIAESTLETVADRAEARLADVDPFAVELPRLNLFPTVVFAEVEADGPFAALHRSLRSIEDVPGYPFEGDDYTPHATLAQFADDDCEEVLEWLEGNRTLAGGAGEPPTTTVDAVDLVTVDPRAFTPRFRTVRRYALE